MLGARRAPKSGKRCAPKSRASKARAISWSSRPSGPTRWRAQAFGDALMPITDLARADVSAYARAIEVDALGASAAELAGWRVASGHAVGRFEIRVRENPEPAQVLYSFIDRAQPPELEVFGSDANRSCAFTSHAASSAGGLHGHLAFPTRALRVRRRGTALRRRHDLGRPSLPPAALPVG